MKGILNIGNSCYLNSILQLLFNSSTFCKIISNNLSNTTNVINIINDNINNYNSMNNKYFNPTNIKTIIDSYTTIFRGTDQNDSSELLIYLFEMIEKIVPDIIHNEFALHCNINIKCKYLQCLHTSMHIEKNLMLYLPLTPTLDDSYRMYKSIERLQGNNMYDCDNCKKIRNNPKTIARKKLEMVKWPNNLIIVIKRFDNMMKKNNNMISIPLEWRHNYKLRGGVIHMGNLRGGHYVYYGYSDKMNKWFFANDSDISLIEDIHVNDFVNTTISKSYILHYEKIMY